LGLNEIKDLKCEGADFEGAIIDDENFLNYLRAHNAKNIPPVIKDKKELRKRLEERCLDQEYIAQLLSCSCLKE
jgi:hypothetical protein